MPLYKKIEGDKLINMMNKVKRGFTLVELIIVIIIVGILAALGISQYSRTVEKGRGGEFRSNVSAIRKFAYNYYLENGACTGIATTELNIGTSADNIPSACRASHYFRYNADCSADVTFRVWAYRCTSGGKSPQGPELCYTQLNENFSTGSQTWLTNCSGGRY